MHDFYTQFNLERLWAGLREGGTPQSCHLTDPGDEQHIDAGCPENATAQECPGSVVLMMRELRDLAGEDAHIDPADIDAYLARRPGGLTKPGLRYWIVRHLELGDEGMRPAPPLPRADIDHPDIGLPAYLRAEGAQ